VQKSNFDGSQLQFSNFLKFALPRLIAEMRICSCRATALENYVNLMLCTDEKTCDCGDAEMQLLAKVVPSSCEILVADINK
jgi:hypothetical protein